MKRMVILWCILIVAVLDASLIIPAWSLETNPWTVNALILFALLLLIELGLVYHHSRLSDLTAILKQSQLNLRHYQPDDPYILHPTHEDK
ncbi:MAG: hypothetical protein Phog2KO_17050 [Phototrophicaceae bacterium]